MLDYNALAIAPKHSIPALPTSLITSKHVPKPDKRLVKAAGH